MGNLGKSWLPWCQKKSEEPTDFPSSIIGRVLGHSIVDYRVPEEIRREVDVMHHLNGHPSVISQINRINDATSANRIKELFDKMKVRKGSFLDSLKKNHPLGTQYIFKARTKKLTILGTFERKPFTEEKAREVFRQIATALHHCHEHRDIKPDYIVFLAKKGNASMKAIDFGLSTFFKPGHQWPGQVDGAVLLTIISQILKLSATPRRFKNIALKANKYLLTFLSVKPLLVNSTPLRMLGRVFGQPVADLNCSYYSGEEIGSGSYGVAKLVINKQTRQQFACKKFDTAGFACLMPFSVRREVEVLHCLYGHPNVIEVKDVVEEEDSVNIILELCEGGQLAHRIKVACNEETAKIIFRQIISALHHMHDLGIMHGDLSQHNILFSKMERYSVKIIDFGVSTYFNDGNSNPRQDIWQAGLILCYLFTGSFSTSPEVEFDKDPWTFLSKEAKDLVMRLTLKAEDISTTEILRHPWFGQADGEPMDNTIMTRMKQFQAMGNFKKVVLKVIAQSLPEEETAGLRNIFELMNVADHGTEEIFTHGRTFEAIKHGLTRLGINLDNEIDTLLDSVDVDGNQLIHQTEFIAATMHMSRIEREGRLEEAFKKFDRDTKGYMTLEDLQAALEECNMANRKRHEVIAEIFKDRSRRFYYAEFEDMMKENN